MTPGRRVALVSAAVMLLAGVPADDFGTRQRPSGPVSPAPHTTAASKAALAGARIPFIANQGQTDPQVSFYARTFGGTVFVTGRGAIVYALPGLKGAPGAALREELVEPRVVAVTGRDRAVTRVSSYVGNDPTRWQQSVPTFAAVSLGRVYPGVEVSLHARANNVEKVFLVDPGADPSAIRVRVSGADALGVDEQGQLEVATSTGTVKFSAPIAFQPAPEGKRPVSVAYAVDEDTYAFDLGEYDPALPLVIDPTLVSTLLGGSGDDFPGPVMFDGSGNLLISGQTTAANFPTTLGAYDTTFNGSTDIFVARFTPDLTTLLAATFFGGSLMDNMTGLALDSAGNVFMVTRTDSTNIPITPGAFQSTKKAGTEVAVAKFDSSLSQLLASTYLGGNRNDAGCCALSVHVDPSDNVFVVMLTNSTDFPTTVGAYDRTYNDFDTDDVAIAKFNNGLTTLLAGTYVGGTLWDIPYASHIDAGGTIWVGGRTSSSNYPVTAGAYHADYADAFPHYDGFLSRLSNNLTTLQASTYIGSTADLDIIWDVKTAADGTPYIVGSTESAAFPTTAGALDRTYNGGAEDGFVAHFNIGLTTLLASTFIGGAAFERTIGLSIDAAGNLHVGGHTLSANYPTTADALSTAFHPGAPGQSDGFYTRLDAGLTSLLHSTYIGGSDTDVVYAPVLDGAGDVYLRGYTFSADFPHTLGAYDTTHNGGADTFAMRYGPPAPPNADPGADAGDHQTVSCDDECEAHVTLDGSGSSDADDDTLSYEWTGPFGTATGVSPEVTLGVGVHEITLTVDDGNGGTATDTVSIAVEDTTAPAFTTTVGPFTISITNAAGTPFTVPLPEAEDNCITVSVTSDAPAVFPLGATTVTFTATDAAGNTATATTTVTVANATPVAAAATVTVNEDGSLAVTLDADDDDGHTLTFIVTTPASHGTLTGSAPSLTYTPNANFNGADSLTFSVDDGFGGTSSAVVAITVSPVNDPPTGTSVSITVNEDGSAAITLAGADVDGDTLSFHVVSGPTHGTLAGAAPSMTYSPAANFHGGDSLTFEVRDGHGGVATATVTMAVVPVNDPPVAAGATVVVNEDGTAAITLSGSDADGDAVTFEVLSGPSHGSLTGAVPSFLYTPHPNFNGGDSITFRAGDGSGAFTTATVIIAVSSVNDSPVASPASVVTAYQTPVGITLSATDADGDALVFAMATAPGNGTVSGSGASVIYTPNAGFSGTDGFTFSVSDGHGGTATAAVAIIVGPAPPPPPGNHPPVAVDDSSSVNEGNQVTIAVLANDTDQDGDSLQATGASAPSLGAVQIMPSGTIVYQADVLGAVSIGLQAVPGLTKGQLNGLTHSLAAAARHIREGRLHAARQLLEEIARRILHFSSHESARRLAAMLQALASGDTITDTFIYSITDGHGGTASATVTMRITLSQ